MKKLLSFSNQLSKSLFITHSHKSLQFQSIFYKSDKYKKVRTLQSAKKQSKQYNQQDKQAQNQHKQQQNNHDNHDDPNQNKHNNLNKTHLTGPKLLTKLIKQGRTTIIPFFVNKVLATRKPSLNIKTFQSNQQEEKEETEQKNQEKNTKQSQQKSQFQQLNDLKQYKKKLRTKVPTSAQYKADLMKAYRIANVLKAANKMQKFQSSKPFLQRLRIILRQNEEASSMFLALFVAIILSLPFFIIYLKRATVQQVNFKRDEEQIKYKQKVNFQEFQILRKLDSIESITFKQLNTNSMRKHLMQIKYKSDVQNGFKEILTKVFNTFSFVKDPFVQEFYTYQNPNLLLSGLQSIQENLPKQNWIKIMLKSKDYIFLDAIQDTLFLASPFVGVAITYWIFRKMNPDTLLSSFTHNKKSMKVQSVKDIKVRFKDVAGMESAKKQITEFVDFLKKNDKYLEMGAKIPKGALLTGPPGTGKTMLAKACAGQAGTSFFYVSGSEFVQMFVGLGASRVRELFAKARQQAPSIIFIDEIDAIGKKRQTSRNQEKDSTLNQLLVEMDGFSSNQTVIVLAATNRKDVLDSALTRPGRFDRMVEVNLPDMKARQQIFMVHLAPLKVNPQKKLSQLAKRLSELSPGFSGADIANLCNQAAIIATRKQRQYIQDADFQQASQRIVAGYVKKGSSTAKTKKRVAYHEAGHAVCGWYLRGGDPLVKLTIIPRSKGALGYAQYLPKNSYIKSKSELIDQVAIMLGGTTSQQLFFGNMSSGASDDLQKVYQLTRSMVASYGMGSQTYNVTLDQERYVKKQSQKLCSLMDQEMLQIVQLATKRAKQILLQKKQIVDSLASELLQKQTINSEDIIRIMGVRPAFD